MLAQVPGGQARAIDAQLSNWIAPSATPVQQQGRLRRLSVAVVVDDQVRIGGNRRDQPSAVDGR